MTERDEALDFWFPAHAADDLSTHREYWPWRMRGGADRAIVERFFGTTERAARGELDDWGSTPRGRLALIVVLDQFSRSVWRDSPRAFARDPKALALALGGHRNGDYAALETVWKKAFFNMPLGHCEGPDLLERVERLIDLAQALLDESPEHLKPMYEFNAQQPLEYPKVIAAFGRHPHRNRILGRASTREELTYLERGVFPHLREVPQMST